VDQRTIFAREAVRSAARDMPMTPQSEATVRPMVVLGMTSPYLIPGFRVQGLGFRV
jgi:hypothetical protein